MSSYHNRSLTELLQDLRDQTSRLFHEEVDLAKTEISDKISHLGRNAAILAAGGLVAFTGVLFLLVTLAFIIYIGLRAAGSGPWLASWLAPFIVGILAAAIGVGVLLKAFATLRRTSVRPEKTVESIQESTQWLKEKVT